MIFSHDFLFQTLSSFPLPPQIFFHLILSLDPSTDIVEPNDPYFSDLLVSHYDCSKQHNLRQFSITRVHSCVQAPSAFESTRANVFVRAKAKGLKAWTCEAYVKCEDRLCTI